MKTHTGTDKKNLTKNDKGEKMRWRKKRKDWTEHSIVCLANNLIFGAFLFAFRCAGMAALFVQKILIAFSEMGCLFVYFIVDACLQSTNTGFHSLFLFYCTA